MNNQLLIKLKILQKIKNKLNKCKPYNNFINKFKLMIQYIYRDRKNIQKTTKRKERGIYDEMLAKFY